MLNTIKYTLFFLFTLLVFTKNLYAEEKNIMPTGDVPTKINADTMDYLSEENIIIFSGDVFVQRADFNLWADKITVYLKENENKKAEESAADPISSMQSGDIDTIIADDNVRMKYNTNTGKSGKAIYEAEKALLIMQQDPILYDNDNSITGEEIRYYLNESRSEVIGGTKRVEAFFSSESAE